MAALKALQLPANSVQNQAVVSMRHDFYGSMRLSTFANEFMHLGSVIEIVPNISGMQTMRNVEN